MTCLTDQPHGRYFVGHITPALIDTDHSILYKPFQGTACWPHDLSALSASNSRKASSSEMSADQPYAAATAASSA